MRFAAAGIVFSFILPGLGCGPGTPPSVRPDPALMRLVPPDTLLLAGARLDHVRETPFYREQLGPRGAAALAGLTGTAGIDLRQDISEILAAFNGTELVVMSRGRFSEREIEARLGRPVAGRRSYKGYQIIGSDDAALVMVDAATVIAGRPERLRAILDQQGQSAGPPPALKHMLGTVERANQFWVISCGGFGRRMAPRSTGSDILNGILTRLSNLKVTGSVSDGVVVDAEGQCATPEQAETLQSALRMMIGLARLRARDRPALTGLLDGIAVSRRERLVCADARWPGKLLARVLAEAGSR